MYRDKVGDIRPNNGEPNGRQRPQRNGNWDFIVVYKNSGFRNNLGSLIESPKADQSMLKSTLAPAPAPLYTDI